MMQDFKVFRSLIHGGLAVITLFAAIIVGQTANVPSGPVIKFNPVQTKNQPANIEVGPLPALTLSKLKTANLSFNQFVEFFIVYVSTPDSDPVPMLGTYSISNQSIIFTPRFPLMAKVSYAAQFDRERFAKRYSSDVAGGERFLKLQFSVQATQNDLAAKITHIYPSANVLPANQLKIYIHFSTPMSFGDAYDHIHLLDENGNTVPRPFFVFDQELWDKTHERFTLLFDPGRIKREIRSNLDLGAPLIAGKKYKLVIDKAWRDGSGNPLDSDVVKEFTVAEAQRSPLDSRNWKIDAPEAGTVEPVKLKFDRPMDHALLQLMIMIFDSNGKPIEGRIEILEDETQWNFRPAAQWKSDQYLIKINSLLEDLAGNNLKNTFDVDLREHTKISTDDFVKLRLTITK